MTAAVLVHPQKKEEAQELLEVGKKTNAGYPTSDDGETRARTGLRKDDDPLLRQLPVDLFKYVVRPEDHTGQLAFVNRSAGYGVCHQVMSVLGGFLCCYSCCNMTVVKEGEIALTQFGDQPEVLAPGRHVLLSPTNQFIAIKQDTDQLIHHGPIHIILVDLGQLGYAIDRDTGRPLLLTQGRHVIRNSAFVWKRFITLKDEVTNLDNIQIIRIETGSVGYCYRAGELEILPPGLHLIQPPDRFGSTMTTQIAILDLPNEHYETSDYVPLQIKAAVFYRIVEPLKALLRIQNVSKQISDTAIATLAGIIRSSSLSDVASRAQQTKTFYHDADANPHAAEEKRDLVEDPSAPAAEEELAYNSTNNNRAAASASAFDETHAKRGDGDGGGAGGGEGKSQPFFEHVHDEFLKQLHDHVIDEWGVEIQNIRIESLKIADKRLQQDISAQAISVSQVHNKYIMLQKNREIIRIEAESRAEKISIDTRAATSKSRMESQARADSVIIEARAEKEATTLKGQGEAEYARLLQSTNLGRELAGMKIQAEAIGSIQQIAYVPHLPGILKQSGVFADSQMLMPIDNN